MPSLGTLPGAAREDAPNPLTEALSKKPHRFLQPQPELHESILAAAKSFLDPLAISTIQGQEIRKRNTSRGKRKRPEFEADASRPLRLREVHTAGFGVAQIWEQASLVLGAAEDELDLVLADFRLQIKDSRRKKKSANPPRKVRFEDSESLESDIEDLENGDIKHDLKNEDDDRGEFAINGEEGSEENIEDSDDSGSSDKFHEAETFIPDPNALNDGFFSIDDFNKQSQFLEQKDGMGEDDNPSDEDDVDWEADPLAVPLSQAQQGQSAYEASEDEDSQSDASDDGPTFGSMTSETSEADEMDLDEMDIDPNIDNTNDVKYSDFFDPPPQKQTKTNRMRALPKTQPTIKSSHIAEENDPDLDADLQRAIANVTRDLEDTFSQDSEAEAEAEDFPGIVKPKTNLSTHEKQTAIITAEIAKLETAAVSKRHWTLAGEALASSRPHNSLISEDLDFERLGKPVPVITAEVSSSIEALIKQRILDRSFDEVRRRLPPTASTASNARRGAVELNDNKPTAGLADEYEAAHLRQANGDKDSRSAATKKQHVEIKKLWADVSVKLDALSNLHFVPKRPELGVTVIADVPTIAMEDARPGAADGDTASRLAPQELFRVGDGLRKGGEEVLMPDGVKGRGELSREEKKRKRKREKERVKKKLGNQAPQGTDQRAAKEGVTKDKRGKIREAEKKTILDDLKKGGVKVIGKAGKLEQIESGKRAKGGTEVAGAAFKL